MQNLKKRDPEKEVFWRDKISKQKRSGLSQNQFCRDNNLNANTFSSWKKVVQTRNKERTAERRKESTRAANNDSGPQQTNFVPLIFPSPKTTDLSEDKVVADVHIGETIVSVFTGADVKTLEAIIIVLKELES